MANKLKLGQPSEEVKEKLKETNISLTDEDLEYSPGNEDQLLERLAKRLHKSREDVKALVESISANSGKAS